MSLKIKSLHLFGGGYLVKVAEEIAYLNGYNVVLRTGERFVDHMPKLDDRTVLLVGDNLDSLISKTHCPVIGDIALSISAPWIFKKKHIDLFFGNFYNIHNQPLPKFKGAGGSSWRILMNDYSGGSAIHFMTEGIDDGEVVQKVEFQYKSTNLYPKDFDEETIFHSSLLLRNWLEYEFKKTDSAFIQTSKYDKSESEYWPRLNNAIHGWINWDWDLYAIKSFCDAFSFPLNGALTTINNINIYIKKVELIPLKNKFHPFQNGLIYNIHNEDLYVAHKDGALIIKSFELLDKEYKIRLGDRLFTSYETIDNAKKTRIQYQPNGKVIKI